MKINNIKRFYTVKIGWYDFNFSNEDEALSIYKAFNQTVSLIDLNSTMFRDVNGYQTLYTIKNRPSIAMETRDLNIVTEEEVKIRREIAEKQLELEKKNQPEKPDVEVI